MVSTDFPFLIFQLCDVYGRNASKATFSAISLLDDEFIRKLCTGQFCYFLNTLLFLLVYIHP